MVKTHRTFQPAVNLDCLWNLVGEQVLTEAKSRKDGKAPIIDVTNYGFSKVIGRGNLPKVPVVVRAKFFSKGAEKKIKDVGGAVELRA